MYGRFSNRKKTRKTRKTCIYWRKTKIYNSKI